MFNKCQYYYVNKRIYQCIILYKNLNKYQININNNFYQYINKLYFHYKKVDIQLLNFIVYLYVWQIINYKNNKIYKNNK